MKTKIPLRLAIEQAYANSRLEGLEPSDFLKELHRKELAGEIRSDEVIPLLKEHYGVKY